MQDDKRTPGFLFYAPFYTDGLIPNYIEDRQEKIIGVTYAPFIMTKLMLGALEPIHRHVSIVIRDGDEILYRDGVDNNAEATSDIDPNPLYQNTMDVDMYGRVWSFWHLPPKFTFSEKLLLIIIYHLFFSNITRGRARSNALFF